jgi:uncharacterized RDD family membrane protein YckC
MDKPTKVVGQRVGAFIIDLIIWYAFNTAIFFLFADKESDIGRDVLSGDIDTDTTLFINAKIGDEEWSIVGGGKFFIYALILFVFWFGYFIYLQGKKGWTPGKNMLGIRVVNEAGQAPGMWKAFVRQFMWIVDSFPWFIPYLTGFILTLSTDKNQRVGDMLAKTYVVKKDAMGSPPFGGGSAGGYGGYSQPPAVGGGFGQPQGGYSPPPPVPQGSGQPADWYPDPQGQARLRYWDGNAWTEHTSN